MIIELGNVLEETKAPFNGSVVDNPITLTTVFPT